MPLVSTLREENFVDDRNDFLRRSLILINFATLRYDIAKQMHFGWWGLSRKTIGLLYLQHNHFCLFVLSPLQYHKALQKAQMQNRLFRKEISVNFRLFLIKLKGWTGKTSLKIYFLKEFQFWGTLILSNFVCQWFFKFRNCLPLM